MCHSEFAAATEESSVPRTLNQIVILSAAKNLSLFCGVNRDDLGQRKFDKGF